jgi:hypothetical protein
VNLTHYLDREPQAWKMWMILTAKRTDSVCHLTVGAKGQLRSFLEDIAFSALSIVNGDDVGQAPSRTCLVGTPGFKTSRNSPP